MSNIQKLLLSPLDQHAPRVYTRMALVFPVTNYTTAIDTLQNALTKTCEQLPYLKGHVVEEGLPLRKQSFLILDPASTPPHFIETQPPAGMPSYSDLTTNKNPFPPEVFPEPMSPGSLPHVPVPVLGASYTKIDGGLIMCIATFHKVVDGSGYSEILKLLAANARGDGAAWVASGQCPTPDEITTRRQRILGGKTEVSEGLKGLDFGAILSRHPEYTLKSKINVNGVNGHANAAKGSSNVKGVPQASKANDNRVFAFSEAKIQQVKDLLGDRLPSEALTVNNILTAIIWPSISHIRTTRSQDPLQASISKIDSPVSGRQLVGKSLYNPPFVGNAIGYAQAEAPISELSFSPSLQDIDKLVPLIKRVWESSASLTASSIESQVQLSDKNPDLSNITQTWLLNGPGDLHFISWAQIAVYELDFGPTLGRPGFMRKAFMRLGGVVNFLPRRRFEQSNGAMDVSVMLREDDLKRLGDDPAWKSWLFEG
ncbi:hypothetical protein DE146DRAFT_738030 [Phaeosphaeria sp. MPI-PUGE-AT-0046c]|nr:hypothetical protein DE146DRAFT_738030 [Phaeosphaeria sp. MPI-PUGE-AT-0046c]